MLYVALSYSMCLDMAAAGHWVILWAFKEAKLYLLHAEKAAPDDAVSGHAGGRRSAGRREPDWVRCDSKNLLHARQVSAVFQNVQRLAVAKMHPDEPKNIIKCDN